MSFEPLNRIIRRSPIVSQRESDLLISRIFAAMTLILEKRWGVERAAYIHPQSFKEGTLKLISTSPAAQQLFNTELPTFLNDLNRQLGNHIVKKIEVRGQGY